MKWYQNWLVMFPSCVAFMRLAFETFYLYVRPKLSFEKNIRWGMVLLYASYLIAKITNFLVTYLQTDFKTQEDLKERGQYLDAFTITLMILYCSSISYIELKLVQLVYILPNSMKWKLIEAEAWAGIYAVIHSTIFFAVIPKDNWTNVWYEVAYLTFDYSIFLVLAIVSFKNAKQLANAPETLLAIRLFQIEATTDTSLSSIDFSEQEQEEMKCFDELQSQVDDLAYNALTPDSKIRSPLMNSPMKSPDISNKRCQSVTSKKSLGQEYANKVALKN